MMNELLRKENWRITRRARALLLILLVLLLGACNRDNEPEATPEVISQERPTSTTVQAQPVASAVQAPLPQGGEYPSQELLAALYDRILPSVVDIEVTATSLQVGMQGQPGVVRGEGTGWVYDDQHIVTNNHVVENAQQITVYFANGDWSGGEVVATDPQADLAVVRLVDAERLELQPLSLAEAGTLDEGHWVLAFGTPFGLEGSMTLGIVSAMGRGFPVASEAGPVYTLPEVIQTDAAINPGNSGGPLLNLNGEVVGVNFAINSPVRANSGVGFAIPVAIVQRVVPALISQGYYAYPYLGISGGTISPQLIEEQGLESSVRGIWASEIVEGGPGAEAGLQPGDIITAIDGEAVYNFDQLVGYLVTSTEPGQTVTLTILRDGEEQQIEVTVAERPGNQPIGGEDQSQAAITINDAIEIASRTVLDAGLMREVESSSAELQRLNDTLVWVVSLAGSGRVATVEINAATGDVMGLRID